MRIAHIGGASRRYIIATTRKMMTEPLSKEPETQQQHDQGVIANRIAAVGEAMIATNIIVASKLRYGAERRGSERLSRQFEAVLSLLPVLPLGDNAGAHYGRLRTDLEKRGQPIGGNDMLIAAHALSLGVTLVTDNV